MVGLISSINILIERGVGTGPMKPGNLQSKVPIPAKCFTFWEIRCPWTYGNAFPQIGKAFFVKRRRINLNATEKEELITHLEKMLVSLQYGSITLVVQDGKIVQIEKNEKVRLKQNKPR